MSYILSNKINLFPFSKPRANSAQRDNRLFYEQNVTNLIKQLVDIDSFAINLPEITQGQNNDLITSTAENQGELEFNIKGYYFVIEQGTTIFDGNSYNPAIDINTAKNLYAKINVSHITVDQLTGQDESSDPSSKFTGLDMVTAIPENPDPDDYYLLLYINDDGWKPNPDGYVRFEFDKSIKITGIDGKYQ